MDSKRQQSSSSNIKVFCRFRPFNEKQNQLQADKVHRLGSNQQLIIKDPNKSEEISFMFDRIFDMQSNQEQIFDEVGSPVLNNILDGFNGTIMAYGQTSSGKTHTMQGYDINDRQQKGLIPRIIEQLFLAIEKSASNLEFKLKISIFEVYMQKIGDLLDVSKQDLKIRQNKNGPYVENLTEAYISDKLQLYKLINLGQKNRMTCQTNMNKHSSRSHLIFLLTLNQFNLENSQSKTSKLFLIDLAGSQKVSKTGAQGKVLEQAKKINLSLTSLGKVIKSLSAKGQHIPYRDSKLTRIIKDSLGGNSKTTLIVTCSPHQMHIPQTLSTLRFGQNAQKIKNKPKINRQLTVQELQKIIDQLQSKIIDKDLWIKVLENYIINQLNASLPQIPKHMRENKYEREGMFSKTSDIKDLSSTLQISSKFSLNQHPMLTDQDDFDEENSFIIETKNNNLSHSVDFNFGRIDTQPIQQNLIQQIPSNNDQQIACLQSQLANYKQNLQSQLNKFYQLKKQYNTLNDNLKSVIQQNIGYQERQKSVKDAIKKCKQQIVGKYQENSRLIFGSILDVCCKGCVNYNDGVNQNEGVNYNEGVNEGVNEGCRGESCYERVREIIDNDVQRLLWFNEQDIRIGRDGKIINIQCYDYWQTQKQAINNKMQQVLQKSINIHKRLQKKSNKQPLITLQQQNPTTQQQQQPQQLQYNKKLLEIQQKFNHIYTQYQTILTQQNNWKIQCQLYQLKIRNRDEKIVQLKGLLEQVYEEMQLMGEQYTGQMSVNTKIVKPIKGGFLFH